MSNHLAIATVTAALRALLQESVVADVPDADVTVTTARPDQQSKFKDSAGVNIFLYRVVPSGAWVHADLPTRRSTGDLAKRPLVGLELHYLISFQGNETRLEPQRLLGSAVRTLTAKPALSRATLRKLIEGARTADSDMAYLAESDLADQVETVRLTPVAMNIEEMSKLWGTFPQTPYQLSLVYSAETVLIEANGTVQPSLPVRRPGADGGLVSAPIVHQVVPHGAAAIAHDVAIAILGANFAAPGARVRIGEATVDPAAASGTRLEVRLAGVPPESLRAGPQGLQVVQPPGGESGSVQAVSSNLAPFVLRPFVARLADGAADATLVDPKREDGTVSGDLVVRVRPHVGRDQRARLLLNGTGVSYAIPAQRREGVGDLLTFPLPRVRAGEYLVRVEIDGAESALEMGPDPAHPGKERYASPKAVIR